MTNLGYKQSKLVATVNWCRVYREKSSASRAVDRIQDLTKMFESSGTQLPLVLCTPGIAVTTEYNEKRLYCIDFPFHISGKLPINTS